jgi:hypothetical protein
MDRVQPRVRVNQRVPHPHTQDLESGHRQLKRFGYWKRDLFAEEALGGLSLGVVDHMRWDLEQIFDGAVRSNANVISWHSLGQCSSESMS